LRKEKERKKISSKQKKKRERREGHGAERSGEIASLQQGEGKRSLWEKIKELEKTTRGHNVPRDSNQRENQKKNGGELKLYRGGKGGLGNGGKLKGPR